MNTSLQHIVNGDLLMEIDTASDIDVVIHVCNCFNVMGSGFALALRRLYPEVYAVDCKTKKGDTDKLGTCSVATITTPSGRSVDVVNMYAQYKYGRDTTKLQLDKLADCLKWVATKYKNKHISMPRIGAGLSGGTWYEIADIVHASLKELDYSIYIYMHIGITNLKNTPTDRNTVKCDRTTALGNPYPLSKYTRDESCDKHYDLLLKQLYVDKDPKVLRQMTSLYDQAKQGHLKLACWCYPARCHTMNIRDILYTRWYAKIIIAGGRNFSDYRLLTKVMDNIVKRFEHLEIVSGLAAGADRLGLQYGKEKGYVCTKFPAKWDDIDGKPQHELRTRNGKQYWTKAGHARNSEMAEYSNVLVAFHDGVSAGTANMIRTARAKHMVVFVIKY